MLERVEPVRRNQELDAAYLGQWVAVKDGSVVAHSQHPSGLVNQLRGLGDEAKGAVVQRIPVPGEPLYLGYMS